MYKSTSLVFFLLFSFFTYAQHFGERDHPMNKLTPSLEVLKYWYPEEGDLLDLYRTAYEVLESSKDQSYFGLSRDPKFRDLAKKNQILILGGPLLGQIKSDGVSVWIRTLDPARVAIEVYKEGFRRQFGPVNTGQSGDLTGIIEITGLEPSMRYNYKIIIDDREVDLDQPLEFVTAPEDTDSWMRVAFGSCPHRWGLGNGKLWNQITDRGNRGMLLLGDIAVQDRNDHLGLHRADYLMRDLFPSWKTFGSQIPVYASWDDHDYFDDDGSGIPPGYSDTDRKGVRQVFQNSWVNRSYGDGNGGIYMRTRIGAFDVIMTDNRYFRTGEKGSFLGEEQMGWLKEQLLDCKGPFIILSCGSMWSDYVSGGKDSWGVNDPEGREEIFSFIEENNIAGVLLISGDRHGARGFTIPRKSGFQFYEFEPASLGARIGPPATKPDWDTQLFGIDGQFAFGEFTYMPSDSDPAVIFRLISDEGGIIYEKEILRSELTPANY